MSAWTDLLLIRRLKTLGPGVLITVRPSLHAIAARFAPPHLITIAQDHLNFESRQSDDMPLELLLAAYRRMDCLAVLTESDAADYRRLLEGATHVEAIPNAVPWLGTEQSSLSNKTVIAGGRLVAQKGFDRLVSAYAPVAAAHPDWQLHIYGNGSERKDLRAQIKRLGIGAQVKLQGFSAEFPAMLGEASVFAMTSRYEGFPMVLIEAMSKGLPLVSFDCPRGPAEIIDDGRNGYLVPDGDTSAFTQALLRVIEDDEGRRRTALRRLPTWTSTSSGPLPLAGRICSPPCWSADSPSLPERRAGEGLVEAAHSPYRRVDVGVGVEDGVGGEVGVADR